MGNPLLRRAAAGSSLAALALVALTACSGTPSDDDVKAACEAKVSRAVVQEWVEQRGDRPWDVTDTKSTDVTTNDQSDDEVHVYDVAGTAVVRTSEGQNTGTTVKWTCFSQYRTDDKKVAAAINSVDL